MKKLIHLGMIAIFAITVSSCSKSANNLINNEKSGKNEPVSVFAGKYAVSPSIILADGSSFYQYINQPYKLQLCNPDSYLPSGETTVFYVIIGPEFSKEAPTTAILTASDYYTSEAIGKYQLISYKEVLSYNVTVPYELIGKKFMFAIVELDNQYNGKTISLYSEITVNDQTTLAHLDNAFIVSSE